MAVAVLKRNLWGISPPFKNTQINLSVLQQVNNKFILKDPRSSLLSSLIKICFGFLRYVLPVYYIK